MRNGLQVFCCHFGVYVAGCFLLPVFCVATLFSVAGNTGFSVARVFSVAANAGVLHCWLGVLRCRPGVYCCWNGVECCYQVFYVSTENTDSATKNTFGTATKNTGATKKTPKTARENTRQHKTPEWQRKTPNPCEMAVKSRDKQAFSSLSAPGDPSFPVAEAAAATITAEALASSELWDRCSLKCARKPSKALEKRWQTPETHRSSIDFTG